LGIISILAVIAYGIWYAVVAGAGIVADILDDIDDNGR